MSETSVDVAILGAGVQGVTAACEAARRGLSVLLVDRGDIGGGASSNSMKIAHGGLRYLQTLDVRRSLESTRERRRLVRLAPDLVRPLPCRMELSGRGLPHRALFRAGLLVNDLLSASRNRGVRADRRLPRSRFPVWHDAIIEDTERMLLRFVHAAVAARPDTLVVTHSEPALVRERGVVTAVQVPDVGEITAGCVLDCRGVWAADRPAMTSVNLVFDSLSLTASGEARALRHPDDGRSVFLVPWRNRTIAGTWNTEFEAEDGGTFSIEPSMVEDVLHWLRPVHPELARLGRGDVRLVHAGLVPRDEGIAPAPSDRARVAWRDDGTLGVSGVKWTTAYGLSVKAVDEVVGRLGRGAGTAPDTPLPSRVRRRIGSESEPTHEEVRFAVENEWARTLDDVLSRRTGLASTGHPGRRIAASVARALQPLLDWSDERVSREVEAFDDDPKFAGNVPD